MTLKLQDTIPYPREVITIAKKAPLMEAMSLMRKYHIHHLIVLEGDTVAGVISDRTILSKGMAPKSVILNPIMTVGDIMKPLARTLTENSDLADAIALMHQEKVSALPLVSKGKLTGIVTESDLLRILRTLLGAVPADNEAEELDTAEKGKLMMGNPLVQNVMKILSEAGI